MNRQSAVILPIATTALVFLPAVRWLGDAPTALGASEAVSDCRAAISSLFDKLLTGIREQDVEEVNALIDGDRMFSEIYRQGVLPDLDPSERTAFRVALKTTIGSGMIEEGQAKEWKTCRIDRVVLVPTGREATVIVRMLRRDGTHSSLVRAWVVERAGRWRVYDWRETGTLLRMSTKTGLALSLFRGSENEEAYRILLAAADSTSQSDYGAALANTQDLAALRLPDVLDEALWILLAWIEFRQTRADTALECLFEASRHDPDSPAIAMMQAAAQNALGNHAQTLWLARRFQEDFGDDARVLALSGHALLAMGRRAEAVEAYRKGLACDPGLVQNLVGLANALPEGQKVEITGCLARLPDPASQFHTVADGLIEARNAEALELFLSELESLSPEPAIVEYYRAKLAMLRGKHGVAANEIKQLLSHATSPSGRQRLIADLLDARIAEGRSVEGYLESPDADYAFGYLAGRLQAEGESEALSRLIETHRARRPDDIRISYYTGLAYLKQKEYPEAEKALAQGMTEAPDPAVREAFRRLCVETRHAAGNGMSAYEDFGPKNATFDQLARLFTQDKDAASLEALIAAHRRAEPDGPVLAVWEAKVKEIEEDYEGAAKLLGKAISQASDDELRMDLTVRCLDMWLVAGKALEAYRQSPDASYAFAYVASKLLDSDDTDGLAKLIAAHREKHAEDQNLLYFEGRLHLLNQHYEQAEKVLTRGLQDAPPRRIRESFRSAVVDARIGRGQGLSAYGNITPHRATFDQLARHFAEERMADDLETLLTKHRGNDPSDVTLGLWEGEVAWIRGDFQKVASIFGEGRRSILSDPDNRGRFEDRLIRSLARLGRFDEALEQARSSTARDGDPWFEAVVHAAAGHVDETAELLETCVKWGYGAGDFYEDPEISAALRSEAFAELREKYPLPKKTGDASEVQTSK